MRPLILLSATLALAGCAAALQAPAIPAGMRPIPVADVGIWARATMPPKWEMLFFKFRLHVEDGSNGGSGYVFVSPPDSLHLDFHTALGLMSGGTSVLGDSALWAEPKDKVQQLVPSYHLLWAVVGVARPPAAGWTAERHLDPKATTVLYTRGSDTVLYTSQQSRLTTYVVEGGRPIGRVWTEFNVLHQPVSSRLVVLISPVQLDVTFDSLLAKRQKHIDRETWNAPASDH